MYLTLRNLSLLAMILLAVACNQSRAAATTSLGDVYRAAGGDFGAFYCSGVATAAHENPYLVEPLRSCEARVQPNLTRDRGVVDPAPLPGYDLALFAVLSHLPYHLAKLFWFSALLASLGTAAFCLTRLTGFPPIFVLLVLIPVDGILNLDFGQLPPIVVAAICLASYLVERRNYVGSAIAAAASLLEPHIGAPVCLAMFLLLPRTRFTLGALAVLILGISFSTGGLALNVDYFTTHIPAQARGELVAADQFGLSAVLHLLGLPDRVALAIGSLCYLAMVVTGICVAKQAALRFSTESFIVVLPAAAVLFGGAYIHDVQFAAALPAALLLCAKNPQRIAAWATLGLLSVPWFTFGTTGYMLGAGVRLICAFLVGWIALLSSENRPIDQRVMAVVAALTIYVAILVTATALPHPTEGESTAIAPVFTAAQASAQENWGAYLRATPTLSTTSAREEFEKAPFWLGLLTLLTLAARVSLGAAKRRFRDVASSPS